MTSDPAGKHASHFLWRMHSIFSLCDWACALEAPVKAHFTKFTPILGYCSAPAEWLPASNRVQHELFRTSKHHDNTPCDSCVVLQTRSSKRKTKWKKKCVCIFCKSKIQSVLSIVWMAGCTFCYIHNTVICKLQYCYLMTTLFPKGKSPQWSKIVKNNRPITKILWIFFFVQ